MKNTAFFSYKGGAGRTSLLFNTLPFIAEELKANENEPIIVLDLDLDSKGLSYLIEKESDINTIQILRGDQAIGYSRGGTPNKEAFFEKLLPIGASVGLDASKDRAILFVTAHEKQGAKTLTENGNYDAQKLSVNLQTLNRYCDAFNCKAIIMDTPAGGQVEGQAAITISTKIITVMRITTQYRKGTAEFINRKTQDDKIHGKEFIIVPNAVPDTKGTDYSIPNIMDNIKTSLSRTADNTDNKLNMAFVDTQGINEVNSFKFREECLRKRKYDTLAPDEIKAYKSYELLAKEIAHANT